MEREVVVQRDRVDAGVDAAAGQQRGQRRREAHAVRVLGDVEGFDAEPVAPEQHPTAVPLDDGEGEHPVQPVDEPVAPPVVGLEQHLGVGGGEEAVAVSGQFAPQILVVVDAAVPGDGQTQVGVDHRLRAGLGQVDDLQAAVAECDPALRPHARRIRATRGHRLGHGRHRGNIGRSAVESHLAGGSTHQFDPTGWRSIRRVGVNPCMGATKRLPAVRRFHRPA